MPLLDDCALGLFSLLLHLCSRFFKPSRDSSIQTINTPTLQALESHFNTSTQHRVHTESLLRMPVQPTLQAFEGAAPEFIRMALQELENTISEWKKLEQAGVRMPAGL
eukprot:1158754-Pelagomonas_calceolata.AAC.4